MAGVGAYAKIEGFVFMPIMSMSMSLPTFVSQNLGAKKIDRAKKGSLFGVLFGMLTAEIMGVIIYLISPQFIKIFVDTPESVAFGTIHARVTALFFFLLALSHCAAGVLRGCGKAFIPMATMLAFWCGVRVTYVTSILKIIPEFKMISWAYPLTWSLSSLVFLIILFRMDWNKLYKI